MKSNKFASFVQKVLFKSCATKIYRPRFTDSRFCQIHKTRSRYLGISSTLLEYNTSFCDQIYCDKIGQDGGRPSKKIHKIDSVPVQPMLKVNACHDLKMNYFQDSRSSIGIYYMDWISKNMINRVDPCLEHLNHCSMNSKLFFKIVMTLLDLQGRRSTGEGPE